MSYYATSYHATSQDAPADFFVLLYLSLCTKHIRLDSMYFIMIIIPTLLPLCNSNNTNTTTTTTNNNNNNASNNYSSM